MFVTRSALIRLMGPALALFLASPLWAQTLHQHDHSAHAEATRGGADVVKRSTLQIAMPALRLLRDDNVRQELREAIGSGAPVFVNFIFTSCTTVCPVMSETFARLAEDTAKAGMPSRLISISIDPEVDTPARLSTYAAQFGTIPAWRFYTGTAAESVAAQKAFGIDIVDKMSHPVATFFYPGTGKIWTRLDGFASPEELAALLPPRQSARHSHHHH